MKTINGPQDVTVGAIVRYSPHDRSNGKAAVGTVTKVSPVGLVIRADNGRRVAAKFGAYVKSYGWLRSSRHWHHNFDLLEPIDIWRRQKPVGCSGLFEVNADGSVYLKPEAMACIDEAIEFLRAAKAWHDAKPVEATP